MASRIIYGYRRNKEHGHIEHRIFDPDDFPEGWYDSPSKVPGDAPPSPPPPVISPEPRRSGPLHGEEEPRKRRRK